MARRKPADTAFYRKVFTVAHSAAGGSSNVRTVRVAGYPAREGNPGPTVTLGIGYKDPDAFAKIFFEVTEENWKVINASVREALKHAASDVKPTPTRPKSEAAVVDLSGHIEPTPQPARRQRQSQGA